MTRLLFLLLASTALAGPVGYPDGYRHWTHLKSMAIGEGHPLVGTFGGLHHVYVNDTGLATSRAGKGTYPDGSVFVFDLLTIESAGGAQTEGARKFTGVMTKDAKKFPTTGGWGFEMFAGDGRTGTLADGGAACFQCHLAQAPTDYVFSRYRP